MTKEEIIQKIVTFFPSKIKLKNNNLLWKDEIIINIPENIEEKITIDSNSKDCISIIENNTATFLIQAIDGRIIEDIITNGNIEITVKENITDELCARIIALLPDEHIRLFAPTYRIERFIEEKSKDITVYDLIRIAFPSYACIIIKNLNDESAIDYTQYAKSFIFNSSMLQSRNYLLVESIEKVSQDIHPIVRRISREGIDIPYRKYIDEVVQYYIDGNSARVPKIKFLSFYNVLEYFFDKIYIDDKCMKIQELITNPKFNHNNIKSYTKILEILGIKKAKHLEKISITESDSLKLLIKKYIKLDEFKDFLNRNTYYLNNNAYKIENTKFSLDDTDDLLIGKICNRIYKVRNALVHSKDDEEIRYIPQKDDSHIVAEIELIKYLAQEIIIETSTLLK